MFNIYRTALSNKIPALLNPHTIPLPSTLQFPHSSRKINEPPQQPKGGKKDEEKKGKGKKGEEYLVENISLPNQFVNRLFVGFVLTFGCINF